MNEVFLISLLILSRMELDYANEVKFSKHKKLNIVLRSYNQKLLIEIAGTIKITSKREV